MSVFYVLHRKVADIFTIFSLIKAFWKLDLHILYKGDKTVEWLWGEILMLNTINTYWIDGFIYKKNPVIISVVFKPGIMAIELCGFNVYWTELVKLTQMKLSSPLYTD